MTMLLQLGVYFSQRVKIEKKSLYEKSPVKRLNTCKLSENCSTLARQFIPRKNIARLLASYLRL